MLISGTRLSGVIRAILLFAMVIPGSGCRNAEAPARTVELPAATVLHDTTFHSEALGRDVTYRVIAPASFQAEQRVRIVYLLHGLGRDFREWSEWSSIAELAAKGYVLVMPEGGASFYVNSAMVPQDRYEDFITHDLIGDAEKGLPRPVEPLDRAIVGVSMGGYGAIVLSLKHPGLYGFAGALSPPVEVTARPFRLLKLSNSLGFRRVFGPAGSATRIADDPFMLERKAEAGRTTFLFLSAGESEPLLEPIKRFEVLLQARNISHEFRTQPGGHDWAQWNAQLPELIKSLEASRNGTP